MSRHGTDRRLVPLGLLTVLGLLTALFAAIAVEQAPVAPGPARPATTVAGAAAATFGSPPGSVPFSLRLINTVASGAGGGTLRQTRVVTFTPPDRMVVVRTAPTHAVLGQLRPKAIRGALAEYAAVTAGRTPWTRRGTDFIRSESLKTYEARVTGVHSLAGNVLEVATVRDGYLVDVRLLVVVPSQALPGGKISTSGVVGEQFQLLTVHGHPVPGA